MEDITPLNLEDQPKLFGLRYDQLIAVLLGLIISTQLYSWLNPIHFLGGQDLRLYVAIFVFMLGPAYCVVTLNNSASHWESLVNFLFSSKVYIPGPDPNPIWFLTDEELVDFRE